MLIKGPSPQHRVEPVGMSKLLSHLPFCLATADESHIWITSGSLVSQINFFFSLIRAGLLSSLPQKVAPSTLLRQKAGTVLGMVGLRGRYTCKPNITQRTSSSLVSLDSRNLRDFPRQKHLPCTLSLCYQHGPVIFNSTVRTHDPN